MATKNGMIKRSALSLYSKPRKNGIYAIEEHFDKHLLEANKFKEAPIIKLSESFVWERQMNALKKKKLKN